jgi:thiamine pyrophosphokinase
VRAIVFDWDGTLVDTLPAILRANITVLEAYGLPFDEARYRAAYAPDWRLMYRRLGVPEEALEVAGARWLALYREAGALAPFAGVDQALRRLAAAGHRLGLVTAGHRSVVEQQLRAFGLDDLLVARVCGDDLLASKPDPEPLLRALAELDAADLPERAIYVGDAPDDMRMAQAIGASGIGIVGALATGEDLVEAGATAVHGSVVEWVDAFLAGGDARATATAGHAIVLGDGDPPTRADLDASWPNWDEGVTAVLAADGGARLGDALGLRIDEWVGDGDSLPRTDIDVLAQRGVRIDLVSAAKDESDLELAVTRAVGLGVRRITVLGALRGPRFDHELANVFLLAHPLVARAGVSIELLDPTARVSLLTSVDTEKAPARRSLTGRVGDLVSLFPIGGDVEGVTTEGLAYPLVDEPLHLGPARGLSNLRTAAAASVSVRMGRLLIVESPATVGS